MLSRVLVGGLLALLGLAVATQVHERGADTSFAAYREEDLLSLVDAIDGGIRRGRADLARLRTARAELRADLAEARLQTAQARDRTAPLEVLAGTEPVTGPGLRITIEDPDGAVDFDLVLAMVEDLRGAGADAIEFDDAVRIGGDSWISGSGSPIVVDGTEVPRPYDIDVVGAPATLAGALSFPRSGADDMRRLGASVTYERGTVDVTSVRDLPVQPNTEPTGPAL